MARGHAGSIPTIRWLGAGLLSDALDVVAGIGSVRTTGTRGVISALIAAPMVLADIWTLTSLRKVDAGRTTAT